MTMIQLKLQLGRQLVNSQVAKLNRSGNALLT